MKKAVLAFLLGFGLFPHLFSGEMPSLPGSLQVYDRQGNLLRSFLSAQQTYAEPVSLEEVSPFVLSAVLAAEDRRFYEHPGIDVRAVGRALWQNIRGGGIVSGASTITQQLARLRRPHRKTWYGKWAEAWDAWALERRYSKEEILRDYLNELEFGNHNQGVQAAAYFYFGVPARELSLAQSALLAGLIQSPTRLNPLKNPKGALSRRGRVLAAMRKNGFITEEQYHLAMLEPLGIEAHFRSVQAPHFVRQLAQMSSQTPQIDTYLDGDLQQYAQRTVQAHLAQLTSEHVTNAAVVVLDNQTGGILAYVGSADFADETHAGQVDGVQAKRQPGSALKPFVYALALQHGFTAASLLSDEDTFFEGGFRPRNYDENFHGKVSLRRALASSYNIPVIKVAEPLGAARILQLLHQLGFSSLNRSADFYGLGLALGGGEVKLIELANAYATLARGGLKKPVAWAKHPHLTIGSTSRVLAEDISYIITNILADNAARADAFGLNSALQFPFPASAKTGTSKDYKDNFAIGYTPRITVAVWAGNFDGSSMQKVSGITGAAPIMHDVLSYANARYPGGEFVQPGSVVAAHICSQSGLLAGPACEHTREEFFTQDTVPHKVCDGKHGQSVSALQITFPVYGDVYVYDAALPGVGQQVHFQTQGAKEPCVWKLNNETLSAAQSEVWWPLQKGKFDLSVSCGGQTAHTFFTVL